MENIRAVIFDLDGVICTTDEQHYQGWQALADRLGIPFADPGGWGLELCFDGVHLTEEDHHRFAKNLQKILDSHPT